MFDGEGVKGDVDFGPTLMLNRKRCILCTRCVRFMRDVDGDAQINIIDRGYGSEIATFQEEGVHSLLSGNLMDVCPVGAITTRDYRFKSRPWDNPQRGRHHLHALRERLQHDRVAQGEARMGEGLAADPLHAALRSRRQRLLDVRHRPLRLSLDRKRRSPAPAAAERRPRRAAAGVVERRCIAGCVERLSAAGTRERRRRALPAVGARVARRAVSVPPPRRKNWSATPKAITATLDVVEEAAAGRHEVRRAGGRRAERRGRVLRAFGSATTMCAALRAAVEGGRVSRALRLRSRVRPRSATSSGSSTRARKGTLPLLVVQGVLLTPLAAAADFVLPGASSVEKEASYTNGQGRLQAPSRALPLVGDSMEDWQILVNLANGLGVTLRYADAAAVRADIAARFAGSTAAWRASPRLRSDSRSKGVTGWRRAIRPSDGSGTSCSRICRR